MAFKKGNKPWNKGKKIIDKPNYGMSGKKHTEETKIKISSSQKGIGHVERHGKSKAKELKKLLEKIGLNKYSLKLIPQ